MDKKIINFFSSTENNKKIFIIFVLFFSLFSFFNNAHKAEAVRGSIQIDLMDITLPYPLYGTITSSPAGIDCSSDGGDGLNVCTYEWISNTSVTLTPTPGPGVVWGGWSGENCNTVTVPYNMTKLCVPIFSQAPSYTVSTSAGSGGSISPSSQSVSSGSTTSFTITPNSGYYTISASGCGGSLSGTTYTTGTITGNCTVSATFASTSCTGTPWGTVANGYSNTAYAGSSANVCSSISQTRTCSNGTMSGTYTYTSCTVNSYYITFNSAGGTAVSSIYQAYGTAITPPANPTRTGYTFTGWSPALASTMPSGGQNLTATWSANACTSPSASSGTTATYYSATAPSGAGCSGQSQTCTAGSWSPAAGSYQYSSCTSGCSDASLGAFTNGQSKTGYASATPAGACSSATVTCTGVSNSGTLGSLNNAGYRATSCVAGCASTPWGAVSTGYSNTAYAAATADVCSSQTRTCTAGTLSGSYTATSCTVNSYTYYFNGNGATGNPSPASVTQNYGTSISAPTSPTRTGYVFNGWSPTIPATMPSGGGTSSAQWIDNAGPTAPGAVTTTWVGDHYVNTSFVASTTGASDPGSGIRGYRLCRSQDNSSGCYAWTTNGEHAGLSETVSGADLPSAGTYRYYYWYAYDNSGNQSANSAAEYIRMDGVAPSTPGSVTTSTWTGDHYVNTSFTAATTGSTDAGVGVRGYRLCRSLDNASGCSVWTAAGEHSGTTEVVSGTDLPSPGTYRYYSWYAYDQFGNQSGTSQDYIRMDTTAPVITDISATNSAKGSTVRFYVTANDGSGVGLNTGNAAFYLGTYPYSGWNRVSSGAMSWNGSQYYYDVTLNDPYGTTYRSYSYVYDTLGNQGARDENPTEFTITNTAPPISTPVSPANGATVNGSGSNVTFTTNTVTDTDGQTIQYYFRVTTGSDAETGVVCNSGWQTSTTYACNPGVGTHYWHVYTYDGVTQTNPNYIWSFYNNYQPTTGTVTPGSGSFKAGAQTFTATYTDLNGGSDISYVHLLINYGVDGNSTAFYGLYYPGSNACHLFNADNAGVWSAQNWSGDVNTTGAKTLPWVTLNSCSSSISGNTLTVNWNLTFTDWNESNMNAYEYVNDASSSNSGWVYVGNGTINVNTYSTYTFDGNGATTNPSPTSVTQNYGTAIATPTPPLKTGYTFTGWSPTIPATMPSGGGTSSAQWSINPYTITFDSAGGTAVTAITQNYGTAITAPGNPTRTGYTFAGWSPSIPATMPATNQTLTATWNIISYTLTVNSNGGTLGGTTSGSKAFGSAISITQTPPTGYSFNGWTSTGSVCTGTGACSFNMPSNAVTVDANYSNTWYTVTFDGNGNTGGSTTAQGMPYNTATALTTNGFTRTGYTFDGWATSAGGAVVYANGANYTIGAGNATLYAHWAVNSSTLMINPNGGNWNGSTSNSTASQNYGTTKSVANPTRTGYTFDGWLLDAYGDVNNYGSSLYRDSMFRSGLNNMYVYNNFGNGTVVLSRVAASGDVPTDSGYMAQITTNGSATPGVGGFYQPTNSYANGIFYHVILAKIPVGYTIERQSNAIGTGGTVTWLTSQVGTGEWQTYVYRTNAGSSGSFSSFGHVDLVGAEGTVGNPVVWQIAYTNIFDATGMTVTERSTASSLVYTYEENNGEILAFWRPVLQSALMITSTTATYGTGLTLTTSGGSGTGNVSYHVDSGSCTISGSTLTPTGAGSCLVTATKAADANYPLPISSSSTAITIAKAARTATLTNVTGTYPTGFNLSYTVSAGAGTPSYSLVSAGTAGCAISADGAVTFSSAGTCTANVTVTADANYLAATSATTTITINKASQAALSITPTTGTYPGPIALSTTGGSGGGAVTYVTSNGTATGCTMTGASLSFSSAGTCIVTATKATDTNYNTVSSSATTITIAKGTPTATLAVNNSPVAYNGTAKAATVAISASSVAGSVGSILTGGSATQTNAGTYAVTASFNPTDTNYNSLTGLSAGNFVISKGSPTPITITTITGVYPGFTVTSTGGVGNTSATTYSVTNGTATGCTINSSTGALTVTTIGTCSVTANKVADDNWAAISSTATTVTITAKQLTISNPTLTLSKVYDGTTTATVTALGTLSGIVGSDTLTVSGSTANYNNANVGTGKTITIVYTGLSGAQAGNYIKPVDYVVSTGIITAVSPVVTTPVSSSITPTSAVLGATVTSLGTPASISSRGIKYGPASNHTAFTVVASGVTTGSFTVNATGLLANTTYYYSGYAVHADAGTVYSTEGTFTTIDYLLPTVTTPAIDNNDIRITTMTARGNIESDGYLPIVARGFVYGEISGSLPGNVTPDSLIGTYPNKVEETGVGLGTGAFSNLVTTGLKEGTTYYMRAYAKNALVGDSSKGGYHYGDEVSFTTKFNPVIEQAAFKIFRNIDSSSVGDEITSQVLSNVNDSFRMRLLMGIDLADLPQGGSDFKLQYARQSGSCDVAFSGENYGDVTRDTEIAYYDNFKIENNLPLADNSDGLDIDTIGQIVGQTYVKSDEFTNNVATIPDGGFGKWDFSLYSKGNASNTTYCFRVVKVDPIQPEGYSLLKTYTSIPQITTAFYRSRKPTNISVVVSQCSDGLENDIPSDGVKDKLDPECHLNGLIVGSGDTSYVPTWDSEVVAPVSISGGGEQGSGSCGLTQCSDCLDNDSDGKKDILDPQCHTNGNINESYVPSNDSETVPPGSGQGGGGQGGDPIDLGYLFNKVYSVFDSSSKGFLKNLLMGMVFNPFLK